MSLDPIKKGKKVKPDRKAPMPPGKVPDWPGEFWPKKSVKQKPKKK